MNKETLKMKALMSLGKLSIVQIDGKTATMAINSEWDLKIDTSFPPELWEAYTRKQKKSFDWTKSPDVPPFVRGVIEELRDIYNDACISLAMSEEEDKTEIEEDSGNETENLEAHNPEKEDEPTQKTIHSAKKRKTYLQENQQYQQPKFHHLQSQFLQICAQSKYRIFHWTL